MQFNSILRFAVSVACFIGNVFEKLDFNELEQFYASEFDTDVEFFYS